MKKNILLILSLYIICISPCRAAFSGQAFKDSIEVYFSEYVSADEPHSSSVRRLLANVQEYNHRIIHFDVDTLLISEAILLPSRTQVILHNCVIKQADYTFDNVFRGDNLHVNEKEPYGFPLSIDSICDISITGLGNSKIVGPTQNIKMHHSVRDVHEEAVGDFYGWRTLQISFSLAKNIEISGIHFEKTRCWAISFDKCSYIKVHDLSFHTNVKNGDGINFRSGCHHCEVYNISGHTSDDTVALTALGKKSEKPIYPKSNYLYPLEPSEFMNNADLGIHDVRIKGIKTSGLHHSIILLSAHDNEVYNVEISDVTDLKSNTEQRKSCIYLYTGYGQHSSSNKIHNVKINNVEAYSAAILLQSNVKCDKIEVSHLIQNNKEGKLLDLKYKEGFIFR